MDTAGRRVPAERAAAAAVAGQRDRGPPPARGTDPRAATASAALHISRSARRSCSSTSSAAITSPPQPNTGTATADSPSHQLPVRHRARVSRTMPERPLQPVRGVQGVRGVGGQLLGHRGRPPPAARRPATPCPARWRAPASVADHAERGDRIATDPLLDVGHPAVLQHPEPGPPARGLAQVGDHVRAALGEHRHRPGVPAQLPQHDPDPVPAVGGAVQQLPGRQIHRRSGGWSTPAARSAGPSR